MPPVPPEHTIAAFDGDMDALRAGLREMGRRAEVQFEMAIGAVRAGDSGLAAQVLAMERTLNVQHRDLDAACQRVIARWAPTAADLREVLGILHAIGDLERIGDEAKKIAKKARFVELEADAESLEAIAEMAGRAGAMIGRAVAAFIGQEPGAAQALHRDDDEVDAMRDRLVERLTHRIGATPARSSRLLELVLMVQSVERVADHAEDIAEYVVHVVRGVDARHGNLPPSAS